MAVQVTIRFGHLDRMPKCQHGRIEGFCSNTNCGGSSSDAAAGEASDVSPAQFSETLPASDWLAPFVEHSFYEAHNVT